MRWISLAAQRSIIRGIALSTLAAMPLHPASLLRAQSPQVAPRPNVRLPDEASAIDAIVRTLIGTFDQVDIVALGEAHERQVDSDLRIALIRHPDFAKKVRTIVIEWGSASEQSALDRYIRGENVPREQLERVWKTTELGANGLGEHPVYTDFLSAVRDSTRNCLPLPEFAFSRVTLVTLRSPPSRFCRRKCFSMAKPY